MSEEQLKAFLEAVKADTGLQEQLKAAGDADAVVAIAKATGFLISAEELKKAQAEVSTVKLSEEELEGVAGGKSSQLPTNDQIPHLIRNRLFQEDFQLPIFPEILKYLQ